MSETSQHDFGSGLREARERRGVSLRQIAVSTKISMSALEALERNDVSSLPGGIFTRSFVRSYASEVGLDPEATLREFLAQLGTDGAVEGQPRTESHEHSAFQSQQRMAGTVLSLVLLAVPIAALLVFIGVRGGDEAAAGAEPGAGELAAAGASDPTLATALPPLRPPPVSAPPPSPVRPVAEAAAVGPLTIDIHPSADCWVSATVDGERQFSRVMLAGEREVLEADEEIVVIVGDAGAFEYAINQRPGRSLGASGEVRTATITRGNYRSYTTQ